MQCPTDGAVLVMSERSGIEIDYCPTCRGVWLDRGELDKIIERASREFAAPGAAAVPSAPAPQVAPPQPAPPQQGYPANPMDVLRQASGGYDDRRYDQRYDRGDDQGYGRKKKKDNWLSELFD
ncbi:zf-TFIIB domain-containing protein [Agromyces aurantiacus]|uniref:Zf-TFIIB domain-containing protein n=1 Tax=Agromyces aurantiacus TaxID=165814 RepID=A0ABV9R133_9MICO|nr:zf-TFIIB domain-containing protein [Agromyces aurantiacus]MBM7505845.1 Zn-finger nucleic acid-binding protein [Agromyces aurantiacus]